MAQAHDRVALPSSTHILELVRWTFVAILAACASSTEPATPDAPPPDAPTANIRFLNGTAWGPAIGTTTVRIPPTSADSYLVIVVGGETSARPSVPEPTEALLGMYARDGIGAPCDNHALIWGIRHVPAGVSTLTFAPYEQLSFAVYVLEFGGAIPVIGQGHWFGHAWGDHMAAAPLIEAWPGMAVISTLVDCGTVTGVAATSRFAGLDIVAGMNVAYYLPTEHGMYGAYWDDSGDGWVATTFVLR